MFVDWLALRQSLSELTPNVTVTIFCDSRCPHFTVYCKKLDVRQCKA